MQLKPLVITNARQNNLKNVSLEIPTQQLVVITGVSGSGKSSLAFETIYAEGHRRFLDSLSNYARQFLIRVEKPDVDDITGLAPTIAIEQKNPIRTSRSTVGTVTELYDFLRLMFARVGQPICPQHKSPLVSQTVETMLNDLLERGEGTKGYLIFPVYFEKSKKARTEILEKLRARGFSRVILGEPFERFYLPLLQQPRMKNVEELEPQELPQSKTQALWMVADRISVGSSEGSRTRFRDVILTCLAEGNGVGAYVPTQGDPVLFSRTSRCYLCGHQSPELRPHLFSFNNPAGACPSCSGFGRNLKIAESKVIPNPQRTIAQGAVEAFTKPSTLVWNRRLLRFCSDNDIDLHLKWEDMPADKKKLIFDGDQSFPGVNGMFAQLEEKWYKTSARVFLSHYQEAVECHECHGARIRSEALSVLIQDKSIHDACSMTLEELQQWVEKLNQDRSLTASVGSILSQLRARLRYLVDVGVGYLTSHRNARTLSGGEIQRINLANQLGADLTRTFYVLDEPTVGLHPRDTRKLIQIMQSLKARGNTLFVVEHDREVMNASDWLVDMGPGAGRDGGKVIFNGAFTDLSQKTSASLTAQYLSHKRSIAVPTVRRQSHRGFIELLGASGNNLKDVHLRVPLGRLIAVSGVSGSGKSTLIRQTLHPAVVRALQGEAVQGLPYKELKGAEKFSDCILLDQSPIGRSPRMVPVSYIKAYDGVRLLFSDQIDSKKAGLKAGDFSFNVSGGRCDQCEGEGYQKVEMYFMDDLYVKCEACEGQRFKPKVLAVKVNGKNIHDVLQMTVTEAMGFFHSYLSIYQNLNALHEVGLGYLQLGQPATTLSGGEAQRLKIARELFSKKGKNILYILDEPTTGLHFEDVRKLVDLLNRLVDQGNTVVVVEHNLDLIKCADWVIDLGPGAAHEGGDIIAEGTPESIAKNKKSVIGTFLRDFLDPSKLMVET